MPCTYEGARINLKLPGEQGRSEPYTGQDFGGHSCNLPKIMVLKITYGKNYGVICSHFLPGAMDRDGFARKVRSTPYLPGWGVLALQTAGRHTPLLRQSHLPQNQKIDEAGPLKFTGDNQHSKFCSHIPSVPFHPLLLLYRYLLALNRYLTRAQPSQGWRDYPASIYR